MTTRVTTGLATSLDGFIAGADDGPMQPLGVGGERVFDWFRDGNTPSRFYEWMRMSALSAEFFDNHAARVGAVITGRRTYDISGAWGGSGISGGAFGTPNAVMICATLASMAAASSRDSGVW